MKWQIWTIPYEDSSEVFLYGELPHKRQGFIINICTMEGMYDRTFDAKLHMLNCNAKVISYELFG